MSEVATKPNSFYMIVGLPFSDKSKFCNALVDTYTREGRPVIVSDNFQALRLGGMMNIDIIHNAGNENPLTRKAALALVPDRYAKICLFMIPPDGKELENWKDKVRSDIIEDHMIQLILKNHKRPDLAEGYEAVLDVSHHGEVNKQ